MASLFEAPTWSLGNLVDVESMNHTQTQMTEQKARLHEKEPVEQLEPEMSHTTALAVLPFHRSTFTEPEPSTKPYADVDLDISYPEYLSDELEERPVRHGDRIHLSRFLHLLCMYPTRISLFESLTAYDIAKLAQVLDLDLSDREWRYWVNPIRDIFPGDHYKDMGYACFLDYGFTVYGRDVPKLVQRLEDPIQYEASRNGQNKLHVFLAVSRRYYGRDAVLASDVPRWISSCGEMLHSTSCWDRSEWFDSQWNECEAELIYSNESRIQKHSESGLIVERLITGSPKKLSSLRPRNQVEYVGFGDVSQCERWESYPHGGFPTLYAKTPGNGHPYIPYLNLHWDPFQVYKAKLVPGDARRTGYLRHKLVITVDWDVLTEKRDWFDFDGQSYTAALQVFKCCFRKECRRRHNDNRWDCCGCTKAEHRFPSDYDDLCWAMENMWDP